MTIRLTAILLGTFFSVTNASCQNANQQKASTKKSDSKQTKVQSFIEQITQLDEFKLAQKQVDSLKKTSGIPIELTIGIIDSSFLKEDLGKNISLGHVYQHSPYDDLILYTVKYDKTNQKIISVDKNSKLELNLGDLPLPTDTISQLAQVSIFKNQRPGASVAMG